MPAKKETVDIHDVLTHSLRRIPRIQLRSTHERAFEHGEHDTALGGLVFLTIDTDKFACSASFRALRPNVLPGLSVQGSSHSREGRRLDSTALNVPSFPVQARKILHDIALHCITLYQPVSHGSRYDRHWNAFIAGWAGLGWAGLALPSNTCAIHISMSERHTHCTPSAEEFG